MLNLGGPAVVRGNGRPTIMENDDPVIALGEDGLDCEGHTRQHDLLVPSIGHVVHVRRAVKVGPDPVASEATDYRETVLPGVLVDGLADGAERDTGTTHVEADGQVNLWKKCGSTRGKKARVMVMEIIADGRQWLIVGNNG